MHQCSRLAGAGTSDEQQRTVAMRHGGALLGIQARMQGRRWGIPGISSHSFDLLRKVFTIHCETLMLLCRCSFQGSPYM